MTLPDQLWGLTLDLAPKMLAEVGDHSLLKLLRSNRVFGQGQVAVACLSR